MAWVKTAPIEARTASTENGSALSSTRISPPAPTASPVLRMVPILPGSRSAWATIQMGAWSRSIRSSAVSGDAIGAEQQLRIVLAAHLGEDVGAGLDRFAAGGLGRGDDLGGERVLGALRRESDDLGKAAAVAGFGQDPQALGEEQPFRAAPLLVAKRAQPLDGGVGESGDLAGHLIPSP